MRAAVVLLALFSDAPTSARMIYKADLRTSSAPLSLEAFFAPYDTVANLQVILPPCSSFLVGVSAPRRVIFDASVDTGARHPCMCRHTHTYTHIQVYTPHMYADLHAYGRAYAPHMNMQPMADGHRIDPPSHGRQDGAGRPTSSGVQEKQLVPHPVLRVQHSR